MIPLTLGEVLAAYVAGLVIFLLLLSSLSALGRSRREQRARRRQVQCALCGAIYEAPTPEPLPACPLCRHLNERNPPHGV